MFREVVIGIALMVLSSSAALAALPLAQDAPQSHPQPLVQPGVEVSVPAGEVARPRTVGIPSVRFSLEPSLSIHTHKADASKVFSGGTRMNSGRSMNLDFHAPSRIHADKRDAPPPPV